MTLSKKQREQLLKQHCSVINDDDAIDPRHYFYNKRQHHRKYRKVFQLCRQVNDTLQMVLTGGNEKLDGLAIVDVVPAPDSRRMLVILGLDPGTVVKSAAEVEQIMEQPQLETPRLRAEIARTINRKKTPNLVFEIAKISFG